MSYIKRIEIYTINESFNIPLASNMNICANLGVGDHLLIYDEEVWVHDWACVEKEKDMGKENFAKAGISAKFVRANVPFLFKPLTLS